MSDNLHDTPDRSDMNLTIFTAWKVFVFGFFLVRIQTKCGRIRTRKWTVLVISQVSQGGNCQQKQNNIYCIKNKYIEQKYISNNEKSIDRNRRIEVNKAPEVSQTKLKQLIKIRTENHAKYIEYTTTKSIKQKNNVSNVALSIAVITIQRNDLKELFASREIRYLKE